MSSLRRKTPLPAQRDFPGALVEQADSSNASAHGARMGLMRRAISREEEERTALEAQTRSNNQRFASTVTIAAVIIAAVRLAREAQVGRPSPRVASVVADSVALARIIREKVLR